MATNPSEEYEARLQRLEAALRSVSRRFAIAVGLLTIASLLLGAIAFTPFGPWVQSRLPWAMNPRFESVAAKQFIVVDGDKELAVFGMNPPKSSERKSHERFFADEPHSDSPVPELAALWLYDGFPDVGEPREYRAIIGFEKNISSAVATNEFLRFQPFMRFKMWEDNTNSVRYRKWP